MKISQNYSFCEHYYVVQITSRLPDYQLAWALNNYAKVGFRKLPEVMVYDPKKTESVPYTLYSWTSPNAIDYFLVTSLNKPAALSSETLLLIEKRERKETVERFVEKVSSFEFVFYIEKISFDAPTTTPKQRQLIEHLNNISIDLEPHLDKLKENPKYYPPKKK
jgi:hypothetical protein